HGPASRPSCAPSGPPVPPHPERAPRAGLSLLVVHPLLVRAADDATGESHRPHPVRREEIEDGLADRCVCPHVALVVEPALELGRLGILGRHDADRDLGGPRVVGAIERHRAYGISSEAPPVLLLEWCQWPFELCHGLPRRLPGCALESRWTRASASWRKSVQRITMETELLPALKAISSRWVSSSSTRTGRPKRLPNGGTAPGTQPVSARSSSGVAKRRVRVPRAARTRALSTRRCPGTTTCAG